MSSTAIKISSALANEARQAADAAHRSLTGQIEHWATIGRSIEPNLTGSAIQIIKKSGDLSQLAPAEREQLMQLFESLRRSTSTATTTPFPRYEADHQDSSLLVQIQADGSRSRGKMVNRTFVPA